MLRGSWKSCLGLMALFVLPAAAGEGQAYEVTVTNLTRGQILSPPLVVSHDSRIALFELGQPASDELAALAEDADTLGLRSLLESSRAVYEVVEGDGVILPGQSATVRIRVGERKRLISLASMLVTTNDAFAAARGLTARPGRTVTVVSPGYDAGSEANNELCGFIPGPPCGNPFQRDPAEAEGYVHVSAGVQGVGDLTAAHDWRNPVAGITVRRASGGK